MSNVVAKHETVDHKTLMASLTADQRKKLTCRSNCRAILPLLLHLGLIVLLWSLILKKIPGWPLLIVPLGILNIFLFTLLHEACHRTPFKSKRINIVLSWVCGLLVVLPPNWFRYFHFEHHRYTQDPVRDPELQSAKPETIPRYLWHLSGLPVWYSQIKTLIVNSLGNCTDRFVPLKSAALVRNESILFILIYTSFFFAALYSGFLNIVLLWIVVLLVGQPFLRLYLMAEHGHCPYVDNMFENTRTTFTNYIVRTIAWNMPYHAEHHAWPNVPYYNLPAFHALVKNHLGIVSDGYVSFHHSVIVQLTDTKSN